MRLRYIAAIVFACSWLAPASALAQGGVASVGGFGSFSLTEASASRAGFGGSVAFDLTPNIQAIGEVGRIGDVLPPTTARLLAVTPFDLHVSAFYGEGGVRVLTSPGSAVTPYAEATAGMARLRTGFSGSGSKVDAIVGSALKFFDRTEPIAGIGGGVLLRGGPVLLDLGYRYKQVFAGSSLASLLSGGTDLRSHQVRVGVGVRF